jgi:hypothetical protein
MRNHRNPQTSVSKQAQSDNTKLSIDVETLRTLLNHAASAAHLVGHLDDDIASGPLGDHLDAIVHKLTELLGDPHTLAAPVSSTRSTFALDVDAVPEHVEPDASSASRTIAIAIVPYRAAGGAS